MFPLDLKKTKVSKSVKTNDPIHCMVVFNFFLVAIYEANVK